MELLYNKWDDISISLYKEIVEATKQPGYSTMEINIAVLALLCGAGEDDIYALSIPEVTRLMSKIDFLDNFSFNEKWRSKKIRLNGKDYNVDTDLTRFTIAQYVDFQTYWGKNDNITYMSNILSCFIIPKGCKYNEGYDIQEVINTIEEYMPITMANAIIFFFLKESVSLIRATKICLELKMNKMMKKDKKLKEMMEAKIQEVQEIVLHG